METKTKMICRIQDKKTQALKEKKIQIINKEKEKIFYLDIQSVHCFSYLNESTAEVRKNILFSVIKKKIYSRLFTILFI